MGAQSVIVLEIVGLSGRISQVYEAMLHARPVTVRELTSETGLAHGAVVSGLRQLERQGLVTQTSGSPLMFAANDPSVVLDMLLHKREEELRLARQRVQAISERFRQAETDRDPVAIVEVISGRGALVQRIDQFQRSAQRELRYFDKPPYHHEPLVHNEAELDLLTRGGRARAIYETGAIRIPDRMLHLDAHLTAGEEARVIPHLPAKLVMVDDRLAMMPLIRDNETVPSARLAIIQRSSLLDSLSHLFETLWQLALPLGLVRPDDPDRAAAGLQTAAAEPDLLERRILGLMNAGLPDEAIGRHLGLSLRTLQRRIRDLMDRLNAYTRYQLGAQVVARGWDLPTVPVSQTPPQAHRRDPSPSPD